MHEHQRHQAGDQIVHQDAETTAKPFEAPCRWRFQNVEEPKGEESDHGKREIPGEGPIGAGSTPWQCDQSHALTGNLVGRILRRDPDSLVLNTDPFGYRSMTLSGKMISIEASPDSPMPNGLINTLDEGQVGDLWAYLGNSSRPGSGDSHLRKNGQQGQ